MSSLDEARQTQLDNIQEKTGKSLDELTAILKKSGLTKHGEIRDYLKRELSLGHGDANALAHATMQSDGQRAAEGNMCNYIVNLTDSQEVDSELVAWIKSAYESAG